MDKANQFPTSPQPGRDAELLSPDQMAAKEALEERLRQASPWLANTAIQPSDRMLPTSEPTTLTAEELRDAQDTLDRLQQPSPWQ